MFNSFSNWINTNIPQPTIPNLPNMPAMPTLPTVNLPSMPTVNLPSVNLPNMTNFFSKSNGNEEAKPAGEQQEGQQQQQDSASNNAETVSTGNENVPVENKTQQQATTSAEANAEQAGETLAENAEKSGYNLDAEAQKALGTAKEIGSNIGNMLFSFGKKASNNVMNTASHLKDVIEKKTLIGEFAKENEKFVNEKKSQQRREEAAVPPWVGYNEETQIKEEILALSTDSRNFLRSPPVGVDYQFDFNVAYPVAMATLEEDSNLKDMRFKLVPKYINEENFWKNYFYRVNLIRQSCQLDELNNENRASDPETSSIKRQAPTKQESNVSQSEQLNANEFVSDSYDHEVINDEEIKSELRQLKLDNKKADDLDADWDKELPEDLDSISAEELEKEINQMIGK